MKQHKVFIINTERETSQPPTRAYSCEKTRLAVYITSRITPRGVKLEVIYRTNQIYSRLGTHSPAAVHRHRLDKCDIDRN